jgi:hypothetical protein
MVIFGATAKALRARGASDDRVLARAVGSVRESRGEAEYAAQDRSGEVSVDESRRRVRECGSESQGGEK